ncbi:MAG: 1-acyl-sn-glycerol-3-phosphate acyltransferase, partial [Candidatus Obscuribacterales bacterium]|nr:1-acyl-sn-glycerol-3-phosphate acyltransferase [Candidatus Obscuribacterales bacterium]
MEHNYIRILALADSSSLLLDPSKIDFWTWTIVASVLLFLGATCALALRVRYWWKEGRKLVEEPGYITPRAPAFARVARYLVSKAFCGRFVGPMKKIGWHNTKYKGRLIVLVNHQTERDAMVIPLGMRFRVVRALMAVTQLFGIRVPAAAWMGIVAVHHDKNPMASLRGMIKVLQKDEDSDCIVFPQGELVRDNHLDRKMFFDGSMMIAKKTADRSKRPVAVLPAAIAYDRN